MSAIILIASMFPMVFSIFLSDVFRRKPSGVQVVEEYEEGTPVAPV